MSDKTKLLVMRLYQIPQMECFDGERKYAEAERLINNFVKERGYRKGYADALEYCRDCPALRSKDEIELKRAEHLTNCIHDIKECYEEGAFSFADLIDKLKNEFKEYESYFINVLMSTK